MIGSVSIFRLPAWMLLAALCGCSWFGGDDAVRERGPKLAAVIDALPALELPVVTEPPPTQAEVMAAYERVYGLIPDSAENHAVGKRIADLRMQQGENLDIEGAADPYASAVTLYEKLLSESEQEGRDEILYQLARAYDLSGDGTRAVSYLDQLLASYPDSPYALEARFRRAEHAFSREDYRAASADYALVVAAGRDTPYWLNANYMLGWAHFKLSDLEAGLGNFYEVVAATLDGRSVQDLPATEQELLDDSFRVVTLALGYLDGAETLARDMAALDRPDWQYLAYQRLADDHLARERYLDSVATWQTFIDHNGLDARAPNAHIGMIETLVRADFPTEVVPKKVQFVERYGVHSEFWQVHDADTRSGYTDHLKTYLNELARKAHGEAQTYKPGARDRRDAYLTAARWYEELVATFPGDASTAEHLFLLGEVYTEADEPARAVAAYQAVLRDYPDDERAGEAGYAAILGLTELVDRSPADEVELWQRLKIDAQIEFALNFPTDERAPAVQTDAADGLFALGEFASAVELSRDSLQTWVGLPPDLTKTLYLILGHGQFELGAYAEAEQAYRFMEAQGLAAEEAPAVREKLLAAIYRQGETAEAAADVDTAIHHWLRIRAVDPAAPLAAQGHFDAAGLLEQSGRLAEAADLLTGFRQSYPEHELSAGLDLRLAGLFEQSEDWSRAAVEYERLAETGGDAEVRRQSLYRAAELYLEIGDDTRAYQTLNQYVSRHPRPETVALEAVHQLDALARQAGDGTAHRQWLARKIELHRAMGRQATERATYLAAEAQYLLAEDERRAFASVRLTHPLPKSLKAKQQALKRTVKAYEQAAAYKVAEFATAATFQIADLYAGLSKAIMASDRPGNLSELELAQYDILLEEQAFPFEEQAISLHEINMRRSWNGVYDEWVRRSFTELRRLMPARFDKQEKQVSYVDKIY